METEPVSPPGSRDRAPSVDDLDAVLSVITACDIEDVGEPDYSLGDLRSDWAFARFDLATDARVLEDADGRIRAYIAIRQLDPGRSFWGDLYVHPDVRGGSAERWAIAFAESRAADLSVADDASLHLYAEDGSELAALLAALGYQEVRRMWRMSLDLGGDVAAPHGPPSGIEIRTFEPDAARAVHAAVEESFADHWDHHEVPFEEWSARKLGHPEFDPSTWWVAWDGDEVAGMVLASVAEGVDLAWISTVGVRPAWRGRGLALGLLRRAFADLAARGMPKVALGVDSENPTGATRLYERAGMHVATCWVRYERPVGSGAAQ